LVRLVFHSLKEGKSAMRSEYPSDISRKQFAIILPILERARKKTRPRTVDLYEVFCGVTYVLKSGCQWRMLPSDFPAWEVCYSYFRQWKYKLKPEQDSLLEEALKKCGWRGETKQWSERKNNLHHRGRAKR
jgi:transposase